MSGHLNVAPNHHWVDIKTVAANAVGLALPICQRLLPQGQRRGEEWVSLNPTRNDRHLGSFMVNLRTGRWADFATGDKGGDLVSLIAYLDNVSQGEAARRLAGMIG
jgi:hypothetical protein